MFNDDGFAAAGLWSDTTINTSGEALVTLKRFDANGCLTEEPAELSSGDYELYFTVDTDSNTNTIGNECDGNSAFIGHGEAGVLTDVSIPAEGKTIDITNADIEANVEDTVTLSNVPEDGVGGCLLFDDSAQADSSNVAEYPAVSVRQGLVESGTGELTEFKVPAGSYSMLCYVYDPDSNTVLAESSTIVQFDGTEITIGTWSES